jgi:hypothetical protein
MVLTRSPASRRLLALATLVLVSLAARAARAQTVTETNGQGPLDYRSDYVSLFPHPNNYDSTWISYEDCESAVVVAIPLTVSQPASGAIADYTIEAFATTVSGLDCGASTSARSGATGQCWQVGIGQGNVASAKASQSATYYVPVRDMLRDMNGGPGVGLAYAPGQEGACHVTTESGVIPIYLWFVLLDSSLTNLASELMQPFSAELIGPAPPTNLSVGVGDGLLVLNWTPASDPSTFGFNIFIDPLPGQEGVTAEAAAATTDAGPKAATTCINGGQAGSGVDGGCHTVTAYEAGAAGASQCPSKILASGVTGTDDAGIVEADAADAAEDASAVSTVVVTGSPPSALQLAQIDGPAQVVGGTQTSSTIKGLKNGVVYTVAVTAFDGLNDNGPLSGPQCVAPSPIKDFFGQYSAAGGLGGGGFCAFGGAEGQGGMGSFAVVAVAAALSVVRRRRSRTVGTIQPKE